MTIYSVQISTRTLEELRELDKLELDLKYRAARQLASDRFMVPGILTDDQVRQVEAAVTS